LGVYWHFFVGWGEGGMGRAEAGKKVLIVLEFFVVVRILLGVGRGFF
jgi:hypothetical protein